MNPESPDDHRRRVARLDAPRVVFIDFGGDAPRLVTAYLGKE